MNTNCLAILCLATLLNIPSTLRAEEMVSGNELMVYLGISTLQNENTHGVVVSRVNSGSPAEVAGITEGDTITKYDDKDISDVHSLVSAQESSKEKVLSGELILCVVNRASETLKINVPMIIVHKKSFVNLIKMSKEKQAKKD